MRASNLDDMFNASPACEPLGLLAPVWRLFVVDDMICSQLLQHVSFGCRGCGSNDSSPCGLGKLQARDAHTARPLRQDPIARKHRLKSVESIPRRQGTTGQCSSFQVAKVLWHMHQSVFVENAVLLESAINTTA
ncbi:hypothetical protein HG530_015138 [Fusarium avenaceum]|nr:hypothetical protein HG530_015138 [Fusarium avenaceum]